MFEEINLTDFLSVNGNIRFELNEVFKYMLQTSNNIQF